MSLLGVDEGDFFRQGGMATAFNQSIDEAQGSARVGLLRNEASGATGKGSVLKLRFKALSAGGGDLRLDSFEPVTFGGATVSLQATPPLRVQVK
jgi:general secretion pathway protein D